MQILVRPHRGALSIQYPRIHSINEPGRNFEAIYFEHALGPAGDGDDAEHLAGALECREAVQALAVKGFRCRRHRAPTSTETQEEAKLGGPARGIGADALPEVARAAEDASGLVGGLPATAAPLSELADSIAGDPFDADADPGPVPYSAMGRPELIALCAERNVPRTGPPAILIQRLEAWDRKNPGEPEADPAGADAGTDPAAAAAPAEPAAAPRAFVAPESWPRLADGRAISELSRDELVAECARAGLDIPPEQPYEFLAGRFASYLHGLALAASASPPGTPPTDPADRPTGEVASPELGDVAGLPDAPAADGGAPASG